MSDAILFRSNKPYKQASFMPILQIFATSVFILDKHWYLWKPELLPIASDLLIASAYYSISIASIYFLVRKRGDRPLNWILFTFTTFIIASGTTHLIESWTLWHPTYWLGYIKLIAAAASMFTAVLLIRLIPKAITQLEALQTDVQQAESALERLNTQPQRMRNNTTKGVIDVDSQENITANLAAAKKEGGEMQEIIARNQQAIIHDSQPNVPFYPSPESLISDSPQALNQETLALKAAVNYERILKWITDKVRDNLDESKILPAAVQGLAEALKLRECNAAWYDNDKNISTICYEFVNSNRSQQGRTAQMKNGYKYLYDLLLAGQYVQFCSLTPHPSRGRATTLAYPIIDDRKEVVGDLWLIAPPDYIFNDLEIRLVQQVASQCAIAARQARLYTTEKAQVEQLKKLHAEKDNLFSEVTHDLQSPMSRIRMAIKMLELTLPQIDERTRGYLDILKDASEQEIRLINDLLTSSLPLRLNDEIDIQQMLSGIIKSFQIKTNQRQQVLQTHLPPDLPVLLSNISRLERIFNELLENAWKYTPAGGEIVLSVNRTSAETISTIANTAEIPADQLSLIFEKGYRVSGTDRRQQSLGLGLATVKKLVTQLQGSISVESANGWTTFTVKLPNQPSEPETV